MTRFARAKGSKSSNERVPEEATAWSTMKQQLLEKNKELEESQNRQKFLNQRNASYKAFLDEKASEEWKKTEWAEFPGITKPKVKKSKEKRHEKTIKNFVNGVSCEENGFNDAEDELKKIEKKKEQKLKQLEKRKKKKPELKMLKEQESQALNSEENIEVSNQKQHGDESVKTEKGFKKINSLGFPKKPLKLPKANGFNDAEDELKKIEKKKEKKLKQLEKMKKKKAELKMLKEQESQSLNSEENIEVSNQKQHGDESVKTEKGFKKINSPGFPKKPLKLPKANGFNIAEDELKKIEKKKEKKLKQLEKRKKKKAELKMLKEQESQALNSEENIEVSNQKQHGDESVKTGKGFKKINSPGFPKKPLKLPKVRDNEEHHRRKPHQPHKMFINGKELEIDYVEGFPVKKEDSLRLKKLRKEMISKGLPRSEINIALKLERRKAEKALAREKKKVCFNCRKSGHNLSECPELNKNQVAPTSGGGICFKCGSTEHTHFECKVVRGQNFNYAHCFVCNEQGHIARQCPDNPKGLYPKGGACKVCGDVTHLKKDCPKYQSQQQKQEDSFKIETYGANNPDDLDVNNSSSILIPNKRSNKIIKF